VDAKVATLLKYRFGVFEQAPNHLHVVEGGRTLFFYRDPHTALTGGTRVVIEFSFGASEQASTVRGSVLSRVDGDGGQTGVWIEFPDSRLARKIDGGAGAIGQRQQRRLGCDLMVEIRSEAKPFLGRMVDVSMGGARIVGPVGLRSGAEIEMRIMGAQPPIPGVLGIAQVMRADKTGDVGIRFVRTDVVARVASSKLYAAVQQLWARAPEVAHSPLCCKDGVAQEPPLPHMMKKRD